MSHISLKARFLLPWICLFGVVATYVFASTTGPAIITNVHAINIIGSAAQITWMTDDPSDSVVFYDVTTASFANTSTSRCDQGGMVTSHCVNLTGLSASTTYYFKARSTNEAQYVAEHFGSFVSATTSSSGGSIPVAPSNLRIGSNPTASTASLLWNDNSSNEDKFNVERKLSAESTYPPNMLAQVNANTTSYNDSSSLTPETSYDYRVQACLSNYGCSAYVYLNGVLTTALADISPPTPPSVHATPYLSTQVNLYVTGATDNVGVVGYKIFRNNTYLTTIASTTYADTNLTPGTSYAYSVSAVDAAGNVSPQSAVVNAVTGNDTATSTTANADTTPPSPPSSISATPFSSTRVDLKWSGASDNIGVVGYKIFRNGTYYMGIISSSYADNNVSPDTAYVYYVKAVDAAGNESPSSVIRDAHTPPIATATSTTPTITPISTETLQSTMVTVTRGTSYCNALIGKTKMTFSATPSSGAYFKLTKSGGTATVTPLGVYDLPNGVYYWEAVAKDGFLLSGGINDKFTLDKSCVADVATTAPASVTLRGDAVVYVSLGGTYVEAGAKGYTATGAAVIPKRDLGGLNVSVLGTYTLRYQLFDALGKVTAGALRTVIVESPAQIVTERQPVLVQPVASAQLHATSVPSEILSIFARAPEVNTLATLEQYAQYCDNPAHQKECSQYVVQQIVVHVGTPTALPVTPTVFAMMQSHGALPGGATNPAELKAVCEQSTHASSCADLYVTTNIMSREEANNYERKLLAMRKGEEQVLTNRVGARMFQDSDGDDIPDYDEVNVYHTDPRQKDTNGDGIFDGQHLLLGTDPLFVALKSATSTTLTRATTTLVKPVLSNSIVYEDPQFSGEVKSALLAVTTIKAVPRNTPNQGTTSIELALSGSALPNSFVTLFIFSDPIVVTVKADDSGAWTYTLDKELPDGTHQVMSTITDGGGHILAKSEPLPFVKEASAVSIGSPFLVPQTEAPGFFSGGSLYALIATLIGVLALALVLIGFIVRRHPSEQARTRVNVEKDGNNYFP